MQDNTLLKIALSLSVIGIVTLFFISKSIAVEDSILSDIGDEIKITGKISKITETGNFTIMQISSDITAIMFEKSDLKQGDEVELQGKLEEYEGEKELIIDEVRIK